MFNFLDEIPALPESASPGLAPLPGDGAPPAASPGFADPAPAAPPPQAAAPAAAPQTSGLGMAEFKSARGQDDKEYLENLPMAQKIGLVLQSYQAGVEGRQNPVEALLANKQKREKEFRAELATTIRVTKEGMEMVRKMPAGKAREAMIEQLVRSSGGNGDMVRAALTSVGGEADREMKAALEVLDTPAAQTMLTQASGGDPVKARQLLANDGFMKRLEQRADQVTLPAVTAKMSVVARTLEKVPGKFKDAEGKVSFTMADLREQNGKLPQQYRLTDAELAAATRNQGALVAYGLKTDETLQKEQEADAKRKDTGTWSEPYSFNGAMVQKNSATGEIRTAVARPPAERPEPAPTVTEIEDPDNPGKVIKVDARTGRRIGAALPKSSGKPTAGQAAVDREFAKEYVAFRAAGGVADAQKQLAQLKDVHKQLGSGKSLSGTLIGNTPDRALAVVNPEALAARDAVEEVVQRNLRLVLGAQFTEKEGERLIARAYNPRLDEAENRKRLGRLITQIERAVKAKQSASDHFEAHGSLREWKGSLPTWNSFDPDSDMPATPKADDALVFDGYRFPSKEALERYKKAKGG